VRVPLPIRHKISARHCLTWYIDAHRRSRDCRKRTFHIQEDSSKWITRDCAHSLLVIRRIGVHGRSLGLRQGVQLVRQHDVRRGSPDLVRHLRHVHPFLHWHEGSRNRPYEPAVRFSPPALCGMVRRHQLLDHLHGGYISVYQSPFFFFFFFLHSQLDIMTLY
jgi:hypothetical protein